MSSARPRWGLVLPQGANLELAGLDPARAWDIVLAAAAEAERLDFDSVWAVDRTETSPRRERAPVFDGWTALAAISQRTERVRLGCLGVGAPLRNPADLAKRTATLDVMSGGRAVLGLEADGYPPEHEAHGTPVPDRARRRAGMTETVDAVRALWSEPEVSRSGEHVRLVRAFAEPKPLAERTAVYVTDPGESGALDPAAVDGVIWHAEPAEVRERCAALAEEWAGAGADFERVERIVLLECRLFDSAAERDKWLSTPYVVIFWSEHPDLYMRRNLAGTPDAVRARLREYLDAGATQFLVWFRDYPDLDSVRRFRAEVTPGLTGQRTHHQ